ncbi:hypothetical protein [Burkholderia territorii]|uniref:Uncharacterized protein n=1 Tax=Burkholderia territorii TaxID=1503055 RepID=A0A6L3NQK7_9BURK|nr:hypothetical protein [Burkholderia territorii]KAB0686160.1 hypothetical protein F7R13_01530 [Burkholderia territorii]MBM2773265.1 hypothetical protein [Burkholderia territorii]
MAELISQLSLTTEPVKLIVPSSVSAAMAADANADMTHRAKNSFPGFSSDMPAMHAKHAVRVER